MTLVLATLALLSLAAEGAVIAACVAVAVGVLVRESVNGPADAPPPPTAPTNRRVRS